MAESVTYTRARARSSRRINIAGAFSRDEPFAPRTNSLAYDLDDDRPDPRGGGRAPNHWSQDLEPRCVTSIALVSIPSLEFPLFCELSAEGEVLFNWKGAPTEKIPGAGIDAPDALGFGRMAHLRQIGRHLYAVGDGGQFYRRDEAAFGQGTWHQLDPGLLQDPDALRDALLEPGVAPVREMVRKVYFCVNGPSEDEVYVCGAHGTLLVWDGKHTRDLPVPTEASLTAILVAPDRTIYVCGRNGTLLAGDARHGFRPAPGYGGGQNFTSMTWFRDRLWLGSGSGPRALWVHEPTGPRRVGVEEGIDDVNVIDAADDEALWIVGAKKLWRYDGNRFERIYDPDMGDEPSDPASARAVHALTAAWSVPGYPDALVRRVVRHHMGAWLEGLARWLGQELQAEADTDADGNASLSSADRDVTVTLSRLAGTPGSDGWVLRKVVMGPRADLPLSLARAAETPDSAATKLGTSMSGEIPDGRPRPEGGRRISWFLEGGVVVELTFGPNDTGIERLVAVRLGTAAPWSDAPP